MQTLPIAEIVAQAGSLTATSPWINITQERIDQFADATEDHQYIHVDVDRAKAETPFGGTIAHGFLSLSLLSKMIMDSVPRADEAVMGINYGFEKIRFLMPVPAGSRLRGHFKLMEITERKPGEYLSLYEVSVEIEGTEKPALVASWLGMSIMGEKQK